MKKIALILGITGQDGSYLAEFLIKKKYQVHGIKRRSSTPNTSRIDHIFDSVNFNNKNLTMHHGDLSDVGSLNRIINEIKKYNKNQSDHIYIGYDDDCSVNGVIWNKVHDKIVIVKFLIHDNYPF